MYKAHTIPQYHILKFVEENFATSHFAFDPLARDVIRVIDYRGDSLCFTYDADQDRVVEIPRPQPVPPTDVNDFLRKVAPSFKKPAAPCLEHIVQWWNCTPNPLTLQQTLGFSDQLYLYFLTRPVPDFLWVQSITKKVFLTPEDKCGIDLWYFNGGLYDYTYECVGNQGTYDRWEIRRMHPPVDGPCLSFCLLDPEFGHCSPFDPLVILKDGQAT